MEDTGELATLNVDFVFENETDIGVLETYLTALLDKLVDETPGLSYVVTNYFGW